MIIVTGGAGFIGSHIVRSLNQHGHKEVIVVDNLANSGKFTNLLGCDVSDYIDKVEFRKLIQKGIRWKISAISHQGACSDTMEYDGRYMMDNNFSYSKDLLHFSTVRKIPFVYASSAAVYGNSRDFAEDSANERPLNIYGFSKLLFDQYVRRHWKTFRSTVVGLRYFNVYGNNERHKGRMASVLHRFHDQLRANGVIEMFGASHGYGPGGHTRDFVYVGDVVSVNLFFLFGSTKKGIVNVGTGKGKPFNELGKLVLSVHGSGEIQYVDMPPVIMDKYQAFTQANLARLRALGYKRPFTELAQGVKLVFSPQHGN